MTFIGIETKSKNSGSGKPKCFACPVPNRTKATLLYCIRKHIKPGSIIISGKLDSFMLYLVSFTYIIKWIPDLQF